MTIQDLEAINEVKNLPDNPQHISKAAEEKRKEIEKQEEENLSKMVRDFIDKSKKEAKPKVVESKEKEESKSQNSSFDEVNDR